MKQKVRSTFWDYSVLSQYRQELFGISILSIVFFHWCEQYSNYLKASKITYPVPLIVHNLLLGSIGVEIFLLLSGIGLYFSLKKNGNISCFYKRRVTKVLIPYLVFAPLVWLYMDLIKEHLGVARYLKDVFWITLFTDGTVFFWYAGFILFMYILFPFIFYVIEKYPVLYGIGFFGILTICIYFENYSNEILKNSSIAWTRIPIFLLGVYLGKKIYHKQNMIFFVNIVAFIGFCSRFYYCGLYFYVKAFKTELSTQIWTLFRTNQRFVAFAFTPLLALLLAHLMKHTPAFIRKLFIWIGGYSFEVYMLHIVVRRIYVSMGLPINSLLYMIAMIIAILCAVILRKLLSWTAAKGSAFKNAKL